MLFAGLAAILVSAFYAYRGVEEHRFEGRIWKPCGATLKEALRCLKEAEAGFHQEDTLVIAQKILAEFGDELPASSRAALWYKIGSVHNNQSHFKPAVRAFQKSIDLSKSSGASLRKEATYRLCAALASMDRVREAVACYEDAYEQYKLKRFLKDAEDLKAGLRHPSDAPEINVTLRFARSVGRGKSLIVRGSWNQRGEHDAVTGWAPLPMTKADDMDDETWTREIRLRTDSDLPYVAVVSEQDSLRAFSSRPVGIATFHASAAANRRIDVRPYVSGDRRNADRPAAKSDGRRRIVVLWPDSGTWLHFMTLVHSDQAPNTKALMESGAFGILDSDPPITSVATEKLTHFSTTEWSLRKWARLGLLQLKGIEMLESFVPDVLLETLLPTGQIAIWDHLKRHGRSSLNLIFSDPYAYAHDEARAADLMAHGLGPIELYEKRAEAAFPDFFVRYFHFDGDAKKLRRKFVETQWKAMHARRLLAEEAIKTRAFDLVIVRYASFDLIHHYGSVLTSSQDTFLEDLHGFYRYADDSIGTLRKLMDADDIFILLSDHGSRDMVRHHRDSVFAAAGDGIPRNRYLGRSDIRVFPGWVVALLGAPAAEHAVFPHDPALPTPVPSKTNSPPGIR